VTTRNLTIEQDDRAGSIVVRPVGRLSVATYPQMRDALLKAAVEWPEAVVVDLAGLAVDRISTLSVFPTVWLRLADWPGIPLLLAAGSGPLAATLQASAVPRFVPVHHDVDAAIGAVGRPPQRRRATLDLPGTPESSARARRWLGQLCADWGLGALPAAAAVATELVENMIHHSGTGGTLRVELRGTNLSLAVTDGTTRPPSLAARGDFDAGCGLVVVDTMARKWGHSPRVGGKVVWAVVDAQQPSGRD
jgi:hypothetical protein